MTHRYFTADQESLYFVITGNTSEFPSPSRSIRFTNQYLTSPPPERITLVDEQYSTFIIRNFYPDTLRPFELCLIDTAISIQLPVQCSGHWVEDEWLRNNNLHLMYSEFAYNSWGNVVFPVFNHHNRAIELKPNQNIARLIVNKHTLADYSF
jgi:hypothetical protein